MCVLQYGPFKVNGEFTSESNQAFDAGLAQGFGGIVDISQLQTWARGALVLKTVHEMPANNLMLEWCKV